LSRVIFGWPLVIPWMSPIRNAGITAPMNVSCLL
jgi:hypothetical protein